MDMVFRRSTIEMGGIQPEAGAAANPEQETAVFKLADNDVVDYYKMVRSDVDAEKERVNEIKNQVRQADLNSDQLIKIMEQPGDYYKKLLILENVPEKARGEKWADWLEKRFVSSVPEEVTGVLSDKIVLNVISYDGEYVNSPYYDTLLYALGENGHASEKSLWKIMDWFKEKDRKKIERNAGLNYEGMVPGDVHAVDNEGDLWDEEYKSLYDINYYQKKVVLDFLGKFGGEQTVLGMVDLVKDGDVEFFKEQITDALSNINPELASRELMKIIADAQNEDIVRRDAGKILYRLELGRIGMSKEGVEYLGRLYDLGNFNNPEFFAQRISPDGKVGIFDKNQELQKYFELGDLADHQTRIKAKVLHLTQEMILETGSSRSVSEAERRRKIFEEFNEKYFAVSQEFFANTGLHFNNFSLQEQGWFLHFVAEAEQQQRKEVFSLAKEFGESGVRSFLSLDYGDELGQAILDIAAKLDKKSAQAVFFKYSEIVDAAYKAKDYLTGHFNSEAAGQEDISRKLAENLLKKGKNLLSEFAKNNTQIESVSVMNKLDSLKTEVLMFAQAFKVLPKEAKFDFNEVEGTEIQDRDSSLLTSAERGQMLEIFELNRVGNYPDGLKKQTLKDFRNLIHEPGHTFRILKHNEKIIAFLHYDQLSKNEIYVGSLNLHPSAKDSPVATAMLKSALEEKGGNNLLKAVVWEKNPAKTYYSMLGFRKVGEDTNYENTGEKYWQMERPPTNENKLEKAA
ncbi:MAG: GNAT family N-acetyltransferase [Candidatus Doudnabacteria bacterium]|nr:GNAT family N-acetyltransferase [Candidatus Doudnabacteria bacterium]